MANFTKRSAVHAAARWKTKASADKIIFINALWQKAAFMGCAGRSRDISNFNLCNITDENTTWNAYSYWAV